MLQVSVIPLNDPLDPLASMAINGPVVFLPAAYGDLAKEPAGTVKSVLDKRTLFDTIFSDMLATSQRHGLVYLLECHRSIQAEREKAVNKDAKL